MDVLEKNSLDIEELKKDFKYINKKIDETKDSLQSDRLKNSENFKTIEGTLNLIAEKLENTNQSIVSINKAIEKIEEKMEKKWESFDSIPRNNYNALKMNIATGGAGAIIGYFVSLIKK